MMREKPHVDFFRFSVALTSELRRSSVLPLLISSDVIRFSWSSILSSSSMLIFKSLFKFLMLLNWYISFFILTIEFLWVNRFF